MSDEARKGLIYVVLLVLSFALGMWFMRLLGRRSAERQVQIYEWHGYPDGVKLGSLTIWNHTGKAQTLSAVHFQQDIDLPADHALTVRVDKCDQCAAAREHSRREHRAPIQ